MNHSRPALAAFALVLSGCLSHLLPEQTVYRELLWADGLADARARAAAEDKPLLVVLAAGELYGPCCVGADALRSGALSDSRVIAFVNHNFVPVWVNVRKDAVPDLPGIDGALTEAVLDRDRHVIDLFSRSFFVRSAIFTPDGWTLLNPAASSVLGSIWTFVEDGHFAFAEMTPMAYLHMLRESLGRRGEGPGGTRSTLILGSAK